MTVQPIIACRQPDTFYCLHGDKITKKTFNGSQKSITFPITERILPNNMAELNGRIYLAAPGYIYSPALDADPFKMVNYNFGDVTGEVISICSLPEEDILAVALSIHQIVILSGELIEIGVFEVENEKKQALKATNLAFKDKNTLTYVAQKILYELNIRTLEAKSLAESCTSYSWGVNSALALYNGTQLKVRNSEPLSVREPVIQLEWTFDGNVVIISPYTVQIWNLKKEGSLIKIFETHAKISSTVMDPNKTLIGICTDTPEQDNPIQILNLKAFSS